MSRKRNGEKLARMKTRCDELIASLEPSLLAFDAANIFAGPATHFHRRAIARHQGRSVSKLIEDERFLDAVYATLTAWGMNSRSARLAEFSDFTAGILRVRKTIEDLSRVRVADLDQKAAEEVASSLWAAIATMNVAKGTSQLVSGTKVLHHFLPDLVPPIDRQFTIQFFFGHPTLSNELLVLREILPRVASLAAAPLFRAAASGRLLLGAGMNTSVTKIIDNAIIGFMVGGESGAVGRDAADRSPVKTFRLVISAPAAAERFGSGNVVRDPEELERLECVLEPELVIDEGYGREDELPSCIVSAQVRLRYEKSRQELTVETEYQSGEEIATGELDALIDQTVDHWAALSKELKFPRDEEQNCAIVLNPRGGKAAVVVCESEEGSSE